ncbi:MAG: hypothetical protein ABEN55_06655, partial [Bradymonadaceae bacterium]
VGTEAGGGGGAEQTGLRFTVSEADTGGEKAASPKTVDGTPLERAEIDTLLGRVTAIETDASDQKSFAFRSRSKPPPTTGDGPLSALELRRP